MQVIHRETVAGWIGLVYGAVQVRTGIRGTFQSCQSLKLPVKSESPITACQQWSDSPRKTCVQIMFLKARRQAHDIGGKLKRVLPPLGSPVSRAHQTLFTYFTFI